MRDPDEGLDASGRIRTGVARAIPTPFLPLVEDLVRRFDDLAAPDAELHLYGSVATGQAVPGLSDVDALAIGVPSSWAAATAAELETAYASLCRGVGLGTAQPDDVTGSTDEAYGNRVFLRHYCTQLAGPRSLRPAQDFAGDAAAARGFNGDIGRLLERWRVQPDPAQRIARKTLFAAAGIVSVAEGTWTTDRATAVDIWSQREPTDTDAVHELLAWSDGQRLPDDAGLAAALAPRGIVTRVAERFAAEIGWWGERCEGA